MKSKTGNKRLSVEMERGKILEMEGEKNPSRRRISLRRLPGSSPGGSREFEVGTALAKIRKQLLN